MLPGAVGRGDRVTVLQPNRKGLAKPFEQSAGGICNGKGCDFAASRRINLRYQ